MFGYIRPFQDDLKMREWARYRQAYCALCKTIEKRYGQLPRMLLTYDLTFLVLFGECFLPTLPEPEHCGCLVKGKGRKRHFRAAPTVVQDFAADWTLLLMAAKLVDDQSEGVRARTRLARLSLHRALKKSREHFPAETAALTALMAEQAKLEQTEAAEPFADLADCLLYYAQPSMEVMALVGEALARLLLLERPELALDADLWVEAVRTACRDLGAWVFAIDALDDWPQDEAKARFNPLLHYGQQSGLEATELKAQTVEALKNLERRLDYDFAILPYEREAEIIQNIVTQGLPAVREKVCRGERLQKL